MEWLKNLSDRLVIWLLYKTSGFGKELTAEGRKEQWLWREQRRRNLDGLKLRSKERFSERKGDGGL